MKNNFPIRGFATHGEIIVSLLLQSLSWGIWECAIRDSWGIFFSYIRGCATHIGKIPSLFLSRPGLGQFHSIVTISVWDGYNSMKNKAVLKMVQKAFKFLFTIQDKIYSTKCFCWLFCGFFPVWSCIHIYIHKFDTGLYIYTVSPNIRNLTLNGHTFY